MAKTILRNDDLVLLLLFKDSVRDPQTKGFPIVTESATIVEHMESAKKPLTQIKEKQLDFLDKIDNGNVGFTSVKMRTAGKVPDNCSVWGWWRKAWEHNEALLEVFSQRCKQPNKKPLAILYNQYLRKAYKAELHDVYFIPKAKCVEVPENWAYKCPEYYSNDPHKCGAFFILEIAKTEETGRDDYDPSELFKDYRVDDLSFPILGQSFGSVISVPEGIRNICTILIDKSPSLHTLKATEHTIFALRKRSQKELTKQLLLASETKDKDLANAFKRTEWADIREILLSLQINGWKLLVGRPETLQAISNISDDKIIRFDIFLVASIISNERLLKDMVPSGDQCQIKTDEFKTCLSKWLLEEDVLIKRQTAANLFTLLWQFIKQRYSLADLTKYFEKLPNMEEIAYSTQYGIKHKFYRDHLNHNIRSALLSAHLASKIFSHEEGEYNKVLIAFLSGLLHDIAHPLALYEKIGKAIEEALALLKLPIASKVQSLIEHNDAMQENLCLVTLLSSIRKLEEKQKQHALLPWKDRDAIIDMVDARILFEEMACAMCDNHALLSAAVVWNTAVHPNNNSNNSQMKDLFLKGSKDNPKIPQLEFLNIIQCIALHDRKGASKSHGSQEEQPNIPTPLDFREFPLPVLTIITDDLQEWGRPIADFRRTLVTDCNISISDNKIKAYYELSIKSSTIGNTPYSFLEHLLAKVRNLSQLQFDAENKFSLEVSTKIVKPLELTNCNVSGAKLTFKESDSPKILWPYQDIDTPMEITLTETRIFLALSHPVKKHGEEFSATADFIVLNNGTKYGEILKVLGGSDSLVSIKVDDKKIVLETTTCILEGRISRYYFSHLNKEDTIIKGDEKINFLEAVGILEIEAEKIDPNPNDIEVIHNLRMDLHLQPCPHFLDLDWRFSFDAVDTILQFVKKYCENGNVAYLGCPTLALYHQVYQKMMANVEYTLFDKGHYAITAWCKEKLIDAQRVVLGSVNEVLPLKMKHKYDIIIMDPPWYEEYYRVFWHRALELIKPGGVIGVAEYPGYKLDKLDSLESARKKMVRAIGKKDFFASIEISYTPPEFEKSWKIDKRYTHTAFSTYRPAYMDFYQIDEARMSTKEIKVGFKDHLTNILVLNNGHHLRCKKELSEYFNKSLKLVIKRRRDLRRIQEEKAFENILAWSTRNTLVEVNEKGKEFVLKSEEDLITLVLGIEDTYEKTM